MTRRRNKMPFHGFPLLGGTRLVVGFQRPVDHKGSLQDEGAKRTRNGLSRFGETNDRSSKYVTESGRTASLSIS